MVIKSQHLIPLISILTLCLLISCVGAADLSASKIELKSAGITATEKSIVNITAGDMTLYDKATTFSVKTETKINDVAFKPKTSTIDKGDVVFATTDKEQLATFKYTYLPNQVKETIVLKGDAKLSFPVTLSAGTRLIPWYNGEYKIVSSIDTSNTMDGIVAAKPFGIDADGKYIEMNYALDKNILTLVYNKTILSPKPKEFVKNQEDPINWTNLPITYPLTIDPTWTLVGGCYTGTAGGWTYYMWNTAGSGTFKLPDIDSLEVILAGGGGGGGTGGGYDLVATYSCTLSCSCTLSSTSSTMEVGVGGLPAAEGTSGNYTMSVTPLSTVVVSVGSGGGGGGYIPALSAWKITGAGAGTCYNDPRYINSTGVAGSSSTFDTFTTVGGAPGRYTASYQTPAEDWVSRVYNNTAYGDDGFYNADGVVGTAGAAGHDGAGYAGGYGYGAGGGGGGQAAYTYFGGAGGAGAKGYMEIRFLTPVPATPVANFTATPRNITVGQSIQFNDTSGHIPTSWAWTFGDTGTSTLQNPTHVYTNDGVYTVSLEATNAQGSNVSTKTNYINVTGGFPFAAFSSNVTSGVSPVPVQFYDNTINQTTAWNWTFGAANFSALKNPIYTFDGVGRYDVSLNATGPGGYNNTFKSFYINATLALTNPNSYINITPWEKTISMNQNGTVMMNIANITGYSIYSNVSYDNHYVTFVGATHNYSVIPGLSVISVDDSINGFVKINVSKLDGSVITVGNSITPIADLTFKAIDFGDGFVPLVFNSPTAVRLTTLDIEGIVNTKDGLILTDAGNFSYNLIINDVSTGTKITTQVTIEASGEYSVSPAFQQTDTGIAHYYSNYGNVRFNITCAGYFPLSRQVLVEGNSDITVSLTSLSGPGQNTWYSPHQVRLTAVDDYYGLRLVGTTLSITPLTNTFPAGATSDWLISVYGVNSAAANDMMNGTLIMSGITGTDGAATFTMLSSIGYNVHITNVTAGIDSNAQIYPISSDYNLRINTQAPADTTAADLQNTKLTYVAPNATFGIFGLTFQDTSARTTSVNFTVICLDNFTMMYSTDLAGMGANKVYANYTIPSVTGERYAWKYAATRVI